VRAVGNYFPANGRFYSMGGRFGDTAGNDFTHPFEFDPATNTWTTKTATYPDNQVNNMACGVLTVGGTPQIYCVGGSAAGATTSTSRVFSYDPVTDTITTLAAGDNWPGNATGTILPGGFAVLGNKLYIIGGFQITTNMVAAVWQFDPTAAAGSRWLQRADYPVARGYVPAAAIGGFIYTAGGSTTDGTTLSDTTDSFKYDPATNTWVTIPAIPRATGETRAVVVNNQMWVLGGGRTAPNPSTEVDIFDPATNLWTMGPAFTGVRRNFPADSDGVSRIWLAGGYDANNALNNTMEIFGVCLGPTPTPGTPSPTATPGGGTPTATPGGGTPTATPGGGTPTATPGGGTPSATPGGGTPTPTPGVFTQALNLSTRLNVGTGDNVGIGGFIVTGTGPVRVIIRAIGPSLGTIGVANPLADPVLELHGPGGFVTITNNNWRDTQEQEIIATGVPPTSDLESAIVVTLDPGSYTAIVSGNENGTGVALVEIYDLSAGATAKLGNISTRGFVGTGTDIIIAGFILGNGTSPDLIVARGIGPSLANSGLSGVLPDPTLELRDSNGAVLFSNNNWQDDPTQAAIITAVGLAPSNNLESAIAAPLPPGAYTALLAGVNAQTGLGAVEIYDNPVGGPTPTPGGGTPTATPGGGGTPTPTPGGGGTPSPTPGGTPGVCTENFDGVTAPALPPGWVASNPVLGDGTMWVTSTTTPDSPPNAAFVPDQDGISDKVLDRVIMVTSPNAILTFRNNFNTEFSDGVYWDGGVLEVSSPNISGGDFLDVTDSHVGGSITAGGYTGEISGDASNPLAGRMAWSGNSGGYIDTVINLGPNVVGQTITLRWRMGTDEAQGAPGWFIDNVSIAGATCQ